MIDIRCSRDGWECGGCPIMEECDHMELTEEIDAYSFYKKGRKDAIDEFKDLGKLYSEIRADVIDKFVARAMTEFQRFEREQGYPKIIAIDEILSNVAAELKEK